jgi:hypothetical protein
MVYREFMCHGLTASDLERVGTRIILDETRDDGDRVLAWTQ